MRRTGVVTQRCHFLIDHHGQGRGIEVEHIAIQELLPFGRGSPESIGAAQVDHEPLRPSAGTVGRLASVAGPAHCTSAQTSGAPTALHEVRTGRCSWSPATGSADTAAPACPSSGVRRPVRRSPRSDSANPVRVQADTSRAIVATAPNCASCSAESAAGIRRSCGGRVEPGPGARARSSFHPLTFRMCCRKCSLA